jgi:hypothetical protein
MTKLDFQNDISLLNSSCNMKTSILSQMIEKVTTELDLTQNDTSEKSMSLMNQITGLQNGLSQLSSQVSEQNITGTLTNTLLSEVQKQLDIEVANTETKDSELMDVLNRVEKELKMADLTFEEMLDDVQAQIDLYNNNTSEKGMTLMGQISAINANITDMAKQIKSHNASTTLSNEAMNSWLSEIENNLKEQAFHTDEDNNILVDQLNTVKGDVQTNAEIFEMLLNGLQIQIEENRNLTSTKDMVLMNQIDGINTNISILSNDIENANSHAEENEDQIISLQTRFEKSKTQTLEDDIALAQQIDSLKSQLEDTEQDVSNLHNDVDASNKAIDNLENDFLIKSDTLMEAIDDVNVQLNLNSNKTSQKSMTLMGHISDLDGKIETLGEDILKEVNNRAEGDRVNNETIYNLENNFLIKSDTLMEAIDDVNVQLDLNQNKTSQKGMTLMGQLSELGGKIKILGLDMEKEVVDRIDSDRVVTNLVNNIGNELELQIEEHWNTTTDMEAVWRDQVSRLNGSIKNVELCCEMKGVQLNQLGEALESAKAKERTDTSALWNEIENLGSTIALDKKQMEERGNEIESLLKTTEESIINDIANLDNGLENASVKSTELQVQLDVLKDIYNKLEVNHQDHRNETSNKGMTLMTQISSLNNALSGLSKETGENALDMSFRVDILSNFVSNLELNVNKNLNTTREKDMTLMNQLSILNNSLGGLDKALEDSTTSLRTALDMQVTDLTQELTNVSNKCAMTEVTLGAVIAEQGQVIGNMLDDLGSRLVEVEDVGLPRLDEKVRNLTANLDSLTSEQRRADGRQQTLKDDLVDVAKLLDTTRNTYATKTEVSALSSGVNERLLDHSESLQRQSSVLDGHSQSLTSHGNSLKIHSDQLSSIEDTQTSHGDLLGAHGSTLDSHDSALDAINNTINGLSAIYATKIDLGTQAERADMLFSSVDQVNADLSQKASELGSFIESNLVGISGLRTDMTVAQSNVTDLDTARISIESAVTLLEKRASAVCTTLTAITSLDGPVHSSTARKLFLDALKRVKNPRQCQF